MALESLFFTFTLLVKAAFTLWYNFLPHCKPQKWRKNRLQQSDYLLYGVIFVKKKMNEIIGTRLESSYQNFSTLARTKYEFSSRIANLFRLLLTMNFIIKVLSSRLLVKSTYLARYSWCDLQTMMFLPKSLTVSTQNT